MELRDVGFEIEAVLETLTEELRRDDRIDQWRLNQLKEDTPLEERCSLLYSATMQHAGLHGIPAKDGEGRPSPRCGPERCRLGGVCFAIQEIAYYVFEREWAPAFVGQADDVKNLRDQLYKARGFVTALHSLAENRKATEAMRSRANNAAALFYQLWDALNESSPAAAERGVGGFPEELETQVFSEQLKSKRGDKLLNAVLKHLREGGFDYPELASMGLVATAAADDEAMADNIKKRVLRNDNRSVRPWNRSEA